MNLEHESREALVVGIHHSLLSRNRTGRGGNLHEAVEQFLDTESIQCRSEEYGRYLTRQIVGLVELGIYPFYQFYVVTQFGGIGLAYRLVDARILQRVYLDTLAHALLVRGEEVER